MVEPFFDSIDRTVGWINNDNILDIIAQIRAFIHNGKVISYIGNYLREFSNGYFWDRNGDAVAFIHGATGSPLLPIPEIAQITPLPPIPPI